MTRAELEQDCDFLGLIIMQVAAHAGNGDNKNTKPFSELAEEGDIWGDSRASPGEIMWTMFVCWHKNLQN